MHTCPERYGIRSDTDRSATVSDVAVSEPQEPFAALLEEDYAVQNEEARAE